MGVSRKVRNPSLRDCAVNWTDDMHNLYSGALYSS
nr:MAG TPA: hypothetical protein [Bacteriophage sp.]